MANTKTEKVENAEYVDSTEGDGGKREALEVLAKAGDVNAQKALGLNDAKQFEGFTVGQPAPRTVYFDFETNKLSDSPVGLGRIVVQEGDSVRQSHIDELHAGK